MLKSVDEEEALMRGNRFIRDELSKGRYDPATTRVCMEILFELFGRTLKMDLGPREENFEVEDIC